MTIRCPSLPESWKISKLSLLKRFNDGIGEKNFRLVKTLLVIGAMTLFLVFIIHWALLQNFRQNFFLSKKPYFEAKLVNRCLLHEKFFAIEVLGQPEKFYFKNSKSKIFVKKGNKIRLSIDERYQDYFYTQNFRYIVKDMLFIAECHFDTSIQRALTSIRDTFSSD